MSHQLPFPHLPNVESLAKAAEHCQMQQQSQINGALATLIGYVGAEAATIDIFERLLWPQRFYNGFSVQKILKTALYMPMGGPLHRGALSTLDKLYANGLFLGCDQGHMLDSPFYHNTGAKYTAYESSDTNSRTKEFVRNGLWSRAIGNISLLALRNPGKSNGIEEGRPLLPNIRSIVRVNYLKIQIANKEPNPGQIVGDETGGANARVYLALICSETVGIITGITVLAIWHSWVATLFLVPAFLKVASAFFAVHRGALEFPKRPDGSQDAVSTRSSLTDEKSGLAEETSIKKFEIHEFKHGFLILEGEESLVLQFFRHYGHPIRCRYRECAQFVIIIAFALVFPLGLLSSLLWMPVSLQYVWLAYQLYTIIALHVYRYTGGHSLCTTEEKIAEQFEKAASGGEKQRVYFGAKGKVLTAELEVTMHSRYKDGAAHSEKLIHGDQNLLEGILVPQKREGSASSDSTSSSLIKLSHTTSEEDIS